MEPREAALRDAIDRIAHSWVSTPFHDHARVKGPNGGTDCAQILLGVYHEAGLIPDVDVGHYSPQFFLHQSDERYLGWVSKFAHEVPLERVRHGDIALYKAGRCFSHAAIVIKPGWPHIIHAHYAARRVRRGFGDAVHLGIKITDRKYFSFW